MENVFVSNHPLVQHKLAVLRDEKTDYRSFRELMRELALLLCYEATGDLPLATHTVKTPMGDAQAYKADETIGLVPVMRAGLGMLDGMMTLLPSVQVWHIGLYRDEDSLRPVQYYNRLPDRVSVQLCLVLDPMLATGGSAVATIDLLKKAGVPRIKYMGVVAAPEGIKTLHESHPEVPVHVAAVDDHLNDIGFIVPGLGDAGDRQFGT